MQLGAKHGRDRGKDPQNTEATLFHVPKKYLIVKNRPDRILITSVKPDAVTRRERTLATSALLGHPEGRSRFLKNALASSGH